MEPEPCDIAAPRGAATQRCRSSESRPSPSCHDSTMNGLNDQMLSTPSRPGIPKTYDDEWFQTWYRLLVMSSSWATSPDQGTIVHTMKETIEPDSSAPIKETTAPIHKQITERNNLTWQIIDTKRQYNYWLHGHGTNSSTTEALWIAEMSKKEHHSVSIWNKIHTLE